MEMGHAEVQEAASLIYTREQEICNSSASGDFNLPLSANVLHTDSKTGSRGYGNLTDFQEAFPRIAQDVTSANFSVVGTSLTPFGCIIANSVLILHRKNHCACIERIIGYVL